MQFRVLGSVELLTPEGVKVELGNDRRRALLAALLARSGQVVSVDSLVELLWREEQPDNPTNSVQVLVSRLRSAVRQAGGVLTELETATSGYVINPSPPHFDATRFEMLLESAAGAPPAEAADLLREAQTLWRGRAFADLADEEVARLEALRLEDLRLDGVERLGQALLEAGRTEEAVSTLEPFVRQQPLRERSVLTLMRALYGVGRHAEAVRRAADHRRVLAEELGLEPSGAVTDLETEILTHETTNARPEIEPPNDARFHQLEVRYATIEGGPIAWSQVGVGPPLVVIPAWVSNLGVMAAGRDPRSSLLERLTAHRSLVMYDRRGTGLTGGEVDDYSVEAASDELERVMETTSGPASIIAVSQAGPAAVILAARRPDLVRSLILFGTYASGRETFQGEVARAVLDLLDTHWGMGSRLLASLYRPGNSDAAAEHLARVMRDSAPAKVAVEYLRPVFTTEVSHLLDRIEAPTLVIHYRGDRVIPFAGGQQLATGIPNARFLALDGPYHLPDASDLDRIVAAISEMPA